VPTKICTKCKIEKDIEEFQNSHAYKSGKTARCKMCKDKDLKTWIKNNKNKHNFTRKTRRDRNKEKNIEKNRLYFREYREKHKEKITERGKLWRKENKEKARVYNAEWRRANPEKVLVLARKSIRKKRSTPQGQLSANLATAIWRSLKGNKKGQPWELLVDYTLDDLKVHLEKQFIGDMSWGNYGKWHIDHKIPLKVFNFETAEHIDFKRCWALSNLQPLWALDNIKKQARIDKPFQPSLLL
jgi:hypothetical protein